MARGLAQHALELAAELARIEQSGERVAADILLELAEAGARVGERGAQQRILVAEPRQRLARLQRRPFGGPVRDLRADLPASHAVTLSREG